MSESALKKVFQSSLKLDDYTIGVDGEKVIDLKLKATNCQNQVAYEAPNITLGGKPANDLVQISGDSLNIKLDEPDLANQTLEISLPSTLEENGIFYKNTIKVEI